MSIPPPPHQQKNRHLNHHSPPNPPVGECSVSVEPRLLVNQRRGLFTPRSLKLVPSMYVVEFEVIYAEAFGSRPLDVRRKFEFRVIYAVGVEGRCSSRDVSSSSSNTSLSFQTRAIRFLRRCWHHSSPAHTPHFAPKDLRKEKEKAKAKAKERQRQKKSTHSVSTEKTPRAGEPCTARARARARCGLCSVILCFCLLLLFRVLAVCSDTYLTSP